MHIGYGDKDRPEDGHTAAKPPVRITSCNLEDAVVRETNLRGVSIEGLTIGGSSIVAAAQGGPRLSTLFALLR
ncbi:hypothetical protein EBB07_30290 [Paenibacillaceae bacterium]|nr:hypothetical protein EBB07_30290 [Paenibacillaceae bacterium]